MNEVYQLAHMGWKSYVGLWNVIDISASVALLLGAIAHFDLLSGGVRTFGAVGVALKWLGLLDFLRCFDATGSLVRMVVVIVEDIKPFMTVLGLALLASVSFLMVNEPESEAFGFDTTARGPLWPLVTVFLAMVGSFEVDDYHGTSALMLCLFLFLVVLVMLNLLCAGMLLAYYRGAHAGRGIFVHVRGRSN